jgi:proteasome lid subunit RPN8/RPN11
LRPKIKIKAQAPSLVINSDVLRRIRQHARSQSKTEVCGILVGRDQNGRLEIEACIPGVNAAQAGTHVTFTQDTWEHIYKIKDKEYPEERIIGWYHSHPGFGVFLSDHDTFIHQNFFSSPQQVAWVYDPHSDEEGCFGWVNSRIERLSRIAVSDPRGGEAAGETGKPEPMYVQEENDPVAARRQETGQQTGREPAWLQWTATIFSYLSIFGCGIIVAWLVFPRTVQVPVPVPVDPETGHILYAPEHSSRKPEQQRENRDSVSGAGNGASNVPPVPAENRKKGENDRQRQ